MADIFMKEDCLNLLGGKSVFFIGDSNMRCLYKDMLYLLRNNNITPANKLATKSRYQSFENDKILRISEARTNARNDFEEREYKDVNTRIHLRFLYTTKVYSLEIKRILRMMDNRTIPIPDIIIMNSCLWDLTRWGPRPEDEYKQNLISLFGKFRRDYPDTMVIWCSTLPMSTTRVKGGLIVKQVEFMKHSIRFMILEANRFSQQLCVAFDIDLVDLHHYMRYQLHRRSTDGIHWDPVAYRNMTCILLTHIALSFNYELPHHGSNLYLEFAEKVFSKSCEEKPGLSIGMETEDLVQAELDKKTEKRVKAKALRRNNNGLKNRSKTEERSSMRSDRNESSEIAERQMIINEKVENMIGQNVDLRSTLSRRQNKCPIINQPQRINLQFEAGNSRENISPIAPPNYIQSFCNFESAPIPTLNLQNIANPYQVRPLNVFGTPVPMNKWNSDNSIFRFGGNNNHNSGPNRWSMGLSASGLKSRFGGANSAFNNVNLQNCGNLYAESNDMNFPPRYGQSQQWRTMFGENINGYPMSNNMDRPQLNPDFFNPLFNSNFGNGSNRN